MPSPLHSLEPAAGRKCRVCGSNLPERMLRCAACGAVHGENYRCPHCKAGADLETAGKDRFRCAACGGPRIFLDSPDLVASGRELPALQRAERARIKGALLRVLGWSLLSGGGLALFAAVATLSLLSLGAAWSALVAATAALPFASGLVLTRMATGIRRDGERALAEAELSVAEDVVRGLGREVEAAELSAILHLGEQRAEELLAELSVNDLVQRRVTEAGSLGYTAPRLRVDLPAERDADLALEEGAQRTRRRD